MLQSSRIVRHALSLALPLACYVPAHAQTAAPESENKADPEVHAPETKDNRADMPWSDIVTFSGYVEAYYAHSFAKPENHVINNRWLDERHGSITLQTVALDIAAEYGPVTAKVTMMFGPTADRWYFEGAQIPAGETDAVLAPTRYSNETWKHIQDAYAGYRAPLGEGLLIQGGLMPTQVGYEAAAVKDNGNWSRSNLFNFLPFFHVGLRASYPVTDALMVTAAVYNGWNQAADLNKGKTLSLQTSLLRGPFLFNLLYLGGNERPRGDPAGDSFRHLFDAVLQAEVSPRLTLALNADAGFERTDLGTDAWVAGALYARIKAASWLYFAARADGIYEDVAARGDDRAPILLGRADHVLSGTLTAELRPVDGISFRVEYRHDDSDPDVPLFYARGVDAVDGVPLQRTSRAQNTLTLGLTGWF